MASPPFSIAETVPGDSDIASAFPAIERTFRDVVESWLLINHNVQGRHDEVAIDYKADPGAGTASVTEVWASSTGNAAGALKMRIGTGAVEWVGNPPGSYIFYAGSTAPNGYLLCYGQAVSRTTYARLFDAIGTTYGVGDGATTFNLPDWRGCGPAGLDDMGGVDAARIGSITLGALIGEKSRTLLPANLPPYTPSGTVSTVLAIEATVPFSGFMAGTPGGTAPGSGGTTSVNFTNATATSTFTGTAQGGTSTSFGIVQATRMCNVCIKT